MPGLLGPQRFPIRDPEDTNQINGRCVNPVRYPEMGGFTGPGKLVVNAKANDMRVEKPTSINASKRTTGRNED